MDIDFSMSPFHIFLWPSMLPSVFVKEIQYIEFFAGTANCFKSAHNSGIPSMAVDIAYFEASSGCQNPFDILTPSGFALLSLKLKMFQLFVLITNSIQFLFSNLAF